jgi:phenylacetate-CoA ligase
VIQAPDLHPAETLDRVRLAEWQGQRLLRLLAAINGKNAFYTRKLSAAGLDPAALRFPGDLTRLPITTKAELAADQAANPPWGTALTEPIARYTRYCQTSSTTGRPLRWIDTPESWQWMLDCWKAVYRAAGIRPGDRVFFPFSFGPFLGFWAGFEAACQLGLHAIPGGGMSSQMRLSMLEAVGATVVCCTPTYALRLAEVAAGSQRAGGPLPLGGTVRLIVVAGEPGGSIPATRARIEQAWSARVIDHHGLTEVGPVSFECLEAPGYLHVHEGEYICEVLDPVSGGEVADGEAGELVITNLGRTASPVIRYRTGDIAVKRLAPCACGRSWMRLEGGILGRADDMINVRGVNVYPAAIEAVIRRFDDVAEFRSVVSRGGAMRAIRVEVDLAAGAGDRPARASAIAAALREVLGLTVQVDVVAAGSLPRFEMKASRFVVEG